MGPIFRTGAEDLSTAGHAKPTLAVSDQPRIGGLFTPAGLAATVVLGSIFCWLFYRWFMTQHFLSSTHMEDWGHAYLIPFISGYLVWSQRAELAKLKLQTFWPGFVVLLTGMMAYFYSVVGIKNHMIQGAAIILALYGLVLFVTGPRFARRVFLAVAFLAFAITVSELIMRQVTFPLQLLASEGAHVMLSIIGAIAGFSVAVDGNVLEMLPRGGEPIPLNVAEACSGMRMVIAFYALAGAVAVLGCRHWWQRILLVLLAAPVALFMNIVRVAVLGLVSLGDPDLASGDAHTLIGTLLLFPSLALFLGVIWALNQAVGDQAAGNQVAGSSPKESVS